MEVAVAGYKSISTRVPLIGRAIGLAMVGSARYGTWRHGLYHDADSVPRVHLYSDY